MMVYRTATVQVDPSLELSRCLTMPAEDSEAMTSRLLGIGSIEAALSDLWAPQCDGRDPRILALSTATRWAARALVDAQAGPAAAADTAERHLRRAVSACLRLPLPPVIDLRVPEGFAYNALHPLAYAAAAAECLRRWRPSRVAILGLRTVGATLAAVVAACCEREGVPTWSGTLRPHGPAFDRVYDIDEAMAGEIAAQRGALCLVVGEGPAHSGSSLVSAAAVFAAHGHAANRIVLLCSRDPLPSTLRSASARQRWTAYARVVAPLRSPAFAEDWSGGAWRQHLLLSPHWPPVHPQHERQKGVPMDAPGQVQKFVGLGSYGAVVCRRATRAAEAGFAVPILGIRDGYLRMARLSPASIMTRRGTRALAEAVQRYLPWRAAAMQTGARADASAVLQLLRVNTQERFGTMHDAAVLRLEQLASEAAPQPAVIIDGHLAPWEWLQTPQGVLKVDTAEHGDDGFQPGPQDIAWDVAAVLAEFAWTAPERSSLIQRLSSALKDPGLTERLRWMRPCYLAARLGYDSMAADSLGDTPDGRRFRRQARRYERQLAAALAY